MIKWNTSNDEIELGQWFKGRIFERRSDLSPNGTRLVYFASKISRQTLKNKDYTYAWTAISKPPYLTALVLWPKGDRWHGGGIFESNNKLWLNHHPSLAVPHKNHQPPRHLTVESNPNVQGEDSPVFTRRMIKTGWIQEQQGKYKLTSKQGWKTEIPEVWIKKEPRSGIELILTLEEINFKKKGGPHIERFILRKNQHEIIPILSAQWADFDRSGKLVFTKEGKLFSGYIEANSLKERQIADFNKNTFTELDSPEWAKSWYPEKC